MTMHIAHITYVTYYRLLLPSLLPHVNSCLYLDCDLVCKSDVSELLAIDLDDSYIAGVRAAGYYWPDQAKDHHRRRLRLPAIDQYVNAGVLLMNLKLMREDGLEDRFLDLVDRGFSSQDQDVLNVACYGHIKLLHPRFNLMTKYPVSNATDYDTTESLRRCFSPSEWSDAVARPVIVHYADRKKPWTHPTCQYADLWFEACDRHRRRLFVNEGLDRYCAFVHQSMMRASQDFDELEDRMESLRAKLQQTNSERWEANADRTILAAKLRQQTAQSSARSRLIDELRSELSDVKRSRFYKARRVIRGEWPHHDTSGLEREGATPRVVLFDVAINTDNLGDRIIMLYSNRVIAELFPGCTPIHVPTHRLPSPEELRSLSDADYKIMCGTNIICPNLDAYSLWKLPEDTSLYRDVTLMGVGMNRYAKITERSAGFYAGALSRTHPLSVRDEYSADALKGIGFDNVLNTHCVSMWSLTDNVLESIPSEKPAEAIFTLTAHRGEDARDRKLIELLLRNYKSVYFWPQGNRDLDYLNDISDRAGELCIIERSLDAYTQLLERGGLDYIGTRLHGGIHALNTGIRTFIISVDNRATEIARDTRLPCFEDEVVDNGLESLINAPYHLELTMNWRCIQEWKRHFIAESKSHRI